LKAVLVPGFTLSDLEQIIRARAASGDPAKSYTARLLAGGVARTAKKFGEEAVEAALAAVTEDDKAHLIAETGDVLYHLLVMLTARGVTLDEVMAELEQRTQESGLDEKAKRKPI
jgi:phosphoribosyl-ATP pyrophosphohydrolase